MYIDLWVRACTAATSMQHFFVCGERQADATSRRVPRADASPDMAAAKTGHAGSAALERARRANAKVMAANKISNGRRLSMILGIGPAAAELVDETPPEETKADEAVGVMTPRAVGQLLTGGARKASVAVVKIIHKGAAEAQPEDLDSELFRRGWGGMYWAPARFTLTFEPGKPKNYELGYSEGDALRVIPYDQLRGVKLNEELLEFSIEFAEVLSTSTVEQKEKLTTLTLRVSTRAEYIRWVAALHDKWSAK